jgi:hypothetical protein
MQEGQMDGAGKKFGRRVRQKYHLEDGCVDGRIILK